MIDKMKIMVVDDNTVNLATVEQELMDRYEVIPMISGRRAIKYLYKEKVDLILLDVQMPLMDGIDTLREIRTQPNGTTVPVIFLTAKKDKATVVEGSKLGIMDFITKPFTSEDLQNRIERVFKRLGRLPMEKEELYNRMKEIQEDLHADKDKTVGFKIDEVLGYQVSDEISGRIKTIKVKLDTGEREQALAMVERLIALLEKELHKGSAATVKPISTGEINARLLYILDDLTNFKIRESKLKVEDILRYDIPEEARTDLQIIKIKLDEYDDQSAEVLTRELLEKIRKTY